MKQCWIYVKNIGGCTAYDERYRSFQTPLKIFKSVMKIIETIFVHSMPTFTLLCFINNNVLHCMECKT